MQFPVYPIDIEQATKILALEENFLNDVKAIEIKPAKLSETVSAFANFIGGDIYIGIDEDKQNKKRHWRGYADPEDANAVAQVLFECHPFGNHLKFEYLSCEGLPGLVLHITVKKVKEIVKSSSGDIFIRVNAGKLKIDTEGKLDRLKLDKGIITFESEWMECPLERVENSESIIHFLINIIPHGEPKTYLLNQELIKDAHVKVCGLLLFCDEPGIYLPKRSSIKIMRYRTKADDIGREYLEGNPLTIEGSAYVQIYMAVDATKKIIQEAKKLGIDGLDSVEYPHDTLHEVITNAVLHRDYSIATDIQIRIFDNRVEVESPGKLPGHVTVKNILDTQSARNPALVRLINKFPDAPNKDVGEGLNTAFRAMNDLRLKAPEIVERDDSVTVFIRHEPLASAETIVMDYMKENEEINNLRGREITGIKDANQMKNVFLGLKKAGLLEPVPGKLSSASAWQKPKKDDAEKI